MRYELVVDDDWKTVAHLADQQIMVTYTCPTCGGVNTLHLQPEPWHVPVDARKVAELNGENGHLHSEHRNFDERRANGEIQHREIDTLTTELWCHRCQRGTQVELRAVGPARG